MRQSDLMDKLAREYPDLEKDAVRSVVKSCFKTLAESLRKGRRVEIRGFGVFLVKSHGARRVKIPNRPQSFKIPPRRLLTFKASGLLLQQVNHTRGR
ncbi:MAG: integration host factor subunit beta [Nitrospirae bacterium]|nr:integration host factor subunit beta [Nitrospirota bacterium]